MYFCPLCQSFVFSIANVLGYDWSWIQMLLLSCHSWTLCPHKHWPVLPVCLFLGFWTRVLPYCSDRSQTQIFYLCVLGWQIPNTHFLKAYSSTHSLIHSVLDSVSFVCQAALPPLSCLWFYNGGRRPTLRKVEVVVCNRFFIICSPLICLVALVPKEAWLLRNNGERG